MPPSWHRKIKESMGSVAVKINFLTHSMAQGKKQEPLTRDGIPGPRSNIQEAVIQGFTARGKDVVSLCLISYYTVYSFTFYKSMLWLPATILQLFLYLERGSKTGTKPCFLPFTDLRLEGNHWRWISEQRDNIWTDGDDPQAVAEVLHRIYTASVSSISLYSRVLKVWSIDCSFLH